MDRTTLELVNIIMRTNDKRRCRDAGNTLIGILPSLDEESIEDVTRDMTEVITYSHDEQRRRVAQDVIITFKHAQSVGF